MTAIPTEFDPIKIAQETGERSGFFDSIGQALGSFAGAFGNLRLDRERLKNAQRAADLSRKTQSPPPVAAPTAAQPPASIMQSDMLKYGATAAAIILMILIIILVKK